MAPLEAPADFRVNNPKGSTRQQIASEFPKLNGLSEQLEDLLIYTASSPAFEELRPFYNAAHINQPGAIVRPRTEAEVAAIIREIQAKSIPFGMRSGAHDPAGAQLQGNDGITIDLRGLDSVVIADDKKSARVGGGILGINLAKFLHEHKLLTPHGWCATVGLAGWALGGGYGASSAFYGLGADQILGARVVLGSGEIVDTDDHPDLLWALRGAGNGTFGVVVELRIKVYPETGFLGGLLVYPDAEVASVLEKYAEMEQDVPVNFTGELMQLVLPGLGPAIAWVFAWTSEDDNVDEGWAFHAKLKALGTPLLDTVAATDDYTFFASFPSPSGNRLHARVRTFESLSPEVATILAKATPPGIFNATVFHRAHGRALQDNPGACFPLRKPHYHINTVASTPDLDFDAAAFESYKKWADGIVDGLSSKGLSLPYSYRNLGSERDVNWMAFFGEETLGKLKDIKKKYDPENVFKSGFPRLDLI